LVSTPILRPHRQRNIKVCEHRWPNSHARRFTIWDTCCWDV